MFNANNRSHVTLGVGAVAATKEVGMIHAQKKMIVRDLSMADIVLIGADAVNYVTITPMVNGVAVAGSVVSTEEGLAAREGIKAIMPELETAKTLGITLEKGDVLSVELAVVGTGSLTNASLHADAEAVGN